MPTVEKILGARPADQADQTDQGVVPGTSLSIEQFLGPRPEQPQQIDVRKMDEILGPPPLDELERRLSDLEYKPTDYEVGRLLDLRAQRGPLERAAKVAGDIGQGVSALGSTIANAATRTAGTLVTDPCVTAQAGAVGGVRAI